MAPDDRQQQSHPDPEVNLFIERFALDSILTPSMLESLALTRHPAQRTIINNQAEIRSFQLLVEGRLQCAHYHVNGTLAVVALMNPLAVIGDVEMFSDERTRTSVLTMLPSVLLGIPRSIVEQDGLGHPPFMRFYIHHMRSKLYSSTSLRLGHLLPVKARFAHYVLGLPDVGNDRVMVLPGKETLASMLGTSLRHLNRVLRELIDAGILGTGYPGVRIRNLDALRRFLT